MIKENGIKVGLSVKPNTPISEIKEYLPYIHMVLIMKILKKDIKKYLVM